MHNPNDLIQAVFIDGELGESGLVDQGDDLFQGGVGFAPSRAIGDLAVYTTVAFTAQAGAGVDLVLGDMFTVGAEAAYLWLSPTYSFGTLKMDGTLLQATFGVRFP